MNAPLIPPRPEPLARPRLGLLWFARVAHSWLDALTLKSYQMLLGRFRLPGMRVFVINDPAWVERMLVTEPHLYPKHRHMHEALEPLIGQSPFTTNGPTWQRQRALLDQAFGHARLTRVFPLMQAACADMLARLRAEETADGAVLDVDTAMTHVTADIVYRTIFSQPLQAAEAQTLFEAFTRYQRLSQRTVFLKLLKLPRWWLERARVREAQVIRGFLQEKVRARFAAHTAEEEAGAADILGGLRTAVDAQDGSRLNETEVLDQICMLFLAGHETSASALGWCLYLLGEAPDLQARLREEWWAATAGAAPQAGAMRQLPRLHALFREVLRLYPPVGYFPREALSDQTIRGAQVRRGDALLVMPWLLHRHRRWWSEPDAFDPERFAPGSNSAHPRGAYLPFGMGARACIGAGFAMQEAALILGSLLSRYELQSLPEHRPDVVGRLTVRSDKGIRVRLKVGPGG